LQSSYLETLKAIQSNGTGVDPGSREEANGLKRFTNLFSELSPERIRERVRDVYADDVYFNDTLKEIRGIDALEGYLVESAEAVESCTVDVEDVASHDGNYYVRWIMDIRFKRFAQGKTTRSIGVSHLRFDARGKIVLHQDYWDAASGLFEHVPLIGYGIRKIKARV
jgi:hypothetical protein